MKTLVTALIMGVIGFGVMVETAEAKRFGGGMSFGSQKAFSKPQQQRSAPKEAPKKQSNTTGTAAGGAAAKSGMMGALGALAVGGLLGALFFGGAFENINFFDVLVFGLIAFLLFKMFAGKRRAGPTPSAAGYGRVEEPMPSYEREQMPSQPHSQQRQGFDTDLMFKKDKPAGVGGFSAKIDSSQIVKPKGFDEDHFLQGAKILFMNMQKAWDNGELADIREFTTDQVFAEIQDQYRSREGENHTEVTSAHVELFDVVDLDSELQASALFTVSVMENGEEVHAQELWHFIKPKHSLQPTWYLDGIQQVEE